MHRLFNNFYSSVYLYSIPPSHSPPSTSSTIFKVYFNSSFQLKYIYIARIYFLQKQNSNSILNNKCVKFWYQRELGNELSARPTTSIPQFARVSENITQTLHTSIFCTYVRWMSVKNQRIFLRTNFTQMRAKNYFIYTTIWRIYLKDINIQMNIVQKRIQHIL